MSPSVIQAESQANYVLKLHFDSGEVRLFDVMPFLNRGIFQELKDVAYFNRVSVAFGGVCWPNEQDFSRDTLYSLSTPVGTVE